MLQVSVSIQKFNAQSLLFNEVFQLAFKAAYIKFSDHFLLHPSHFLFYATQIFDPQFIQLTSANCDIQKHTTDIPELANPSIALIQEGSLL